MHRFPAEHDQQQAHALDILKKADSFILIHFRDEECENLLCVLSHNHRSTSVIASCTNRDLQRAMEALGEEIMLAASVDALMSLDPGQREQIAALLLDKEAAPFLRLHDDEEEA